MLAGAKHVLQSQRSLVRADSVINTTIIGARFCQDFVFKAASEEFAKLTYASIKLTCGIHSFHFHSILRQLLNCTLTVTSLMLHYPQRYSYKHLHYQ